MNTRIAVGVTSAIAALPLAVFAQGIGMPSVPGVQFDANGGVDVAGMHVGSDISGGANVQAGDVSVSSGSNGVNVKAGGVQVQAGANGAVVTVPGIGAIRSNDAVMKYVEKLEADGNVTVATSSTDEISLSYLEPAKLFGFIPMQVPVTATAKSDGNLSVDYPWYGFAVKGEKEKVAGKLEESIGAKLDSQNGASFSASFQAYILNAMQSAFDSIFKGTQN